jgi:hypothetical protein
MAPGKAVHRGRQSLYFCFRRGGSAGGGEARDQEGARPPVRPGELSQILPTPAHFAAGGRPGRPGAVSSSILVDQIRTALDAMRKFADARVHDQLYARDIIPTYT